MRILLDECVPRPLVTALGDLPHEFVHATAASLSGLSNGALHAFAMQSFD